MYLAEVVNEALENLAIPDFQQTVKRLPHSSGVRFTLERSRQLIDEYDLYNFDRSALVAASDLKTERQEGLEAIAERVLESPKRIFMESSWCDRQKAFSRVPQMPLREVAFDYGQPVRVGISLKVHGDGRGTLQTAWTHPISSLRDLASEGFFREVRCAKKHQKALKRLLTLNWSLFLIDIDINDRSTITRSEFLDRCHAGDPECFPFMAAQQEISVRLGERSLVDRAFALYRLNRICRYRLHPDGKNYLREMAVLSGTSFESFLDTLRSDLDGEIVFGLALAALLELRSVEIRRTKEINAARSSRKVRDRIHVGQRSSPLPTLGHVSLDIAPDIVASYFQGAMSEKHTIDTENAHRRSPVAHPVQGHLFRARNGEIVYRKPHWRGTDQRKRIVTVRS